MQENNFVGALIIAIGLIVAAISFALVGALLQTADGATELRLDRIEEQAKARSDENSALKEQLRVAMDDISRLKEDTALLAGRVATRSEITSNTEGLGLQSAIDGHPASEELTEEMRLAKSRFNKGVTQPRNSTMLDVLGQPRNRYGQNCQPVTNPNLKALMETRQVGPIRVTMIRPALASLERIMAQLKISDPDIHDALGTAGALCVRLIRGSSSSISNHSWGTAIDVKLEGKLDGFGDGGTQFGLLILAELFNNEGWFWGATYNREDSMHFEVGEETLKRWRDDGLL